MEQRRGLPRLDFDSRRLTPRPRDCLRQSRRKARDLERKATGRQVLPIGHRRGLTPHGDLDVRAVNQHVGPHPRRIARRCAWRFAQNVVRIRVWLRMRAPARSSTGRLLRFAAGANVGMDWVACRCLRAREC
jgi:hypothetical protein